MALFIAFYIILAFSNVKNKGLYAKHLMEIQNLK